jgi:hypothetical protein
MCEVTSTLGKVSSRANSSLVGTLSDKSLVEIIGFFLVHVDSQIADLAGFQELDHLVGFQQGAATGVDDEHTVFEIGQGFLVENVVGFRGQRAMQGDDVGLAGEGGTVHVGGPLFSPSSLGYLS